MFRSRERQPHIFPDAAKEEPAVFERLGETQAKIEEKKKEIEQTKREAAEYEQQALAWQDKLNQAIEDMGELTETDKKLIKEKFREAKEIKQEKQEDVIGNVIGWVRDKFGSKIAGKLAQSAVVAGIMFGAPSISAISQPARAEASSPELSSRFEKAQQVVFQELTALVEGLPTMTAAQREELVGKLNTRLFYMGMEAGSDKEQQAFVETIKQEFIELCRSQGIEISPEEMPLVFKSDGGLMVYDTLANLEKLLAAAELSYKPLEMETVKWSNWDRDSRKDVLAVIKKEEKIGWSRMPAGSKVYTYQDGQKQKIVIEPMRKGDSWPNSAIVLEKDSQGEMKFVEFDNYLVLQRKYYRQEDYEEFIDIFYKDNPEEQQSMHELLEAAFKIEYADRNYQNFYQPLDELKKDMDVMESYLLRAGADDDLSDWQFLSSDERSARDLSSQLMGLLGHIEISDYGRPLNKEDLLVSSSIRIDNYNKAVDLLFESEKEKGVSQAEVLKRLFKGLEFYFGANDVKGGFVQEQVNAKIFEKILFDEKTGKIIGEIIDQSRDTGVGGVRGANHIKESKKWRIITSGAIKKIDIKRFDQSYESSEFIKTEYKCGKSVKENFSWEKSPKGKDYFVLENKDTKERYQLFIREVYSESRQYNTKLLSSEIYEIQEAEKQGKKIEIAVKSEQFYIDEQMDKENQIQRQIQFR